MTGRVYIAFGRTFLPVPFRSSGKLKLLGQPLNGCFSPDKQRIPIPPSLPAPSLMRTGGRTSLPPQSYPYPDKQPGRSRKAGLYSKMWRARPSKFYFRDIHICNISKAQPMAPFDNFDINRGALLTARTVSSEPHCNPSGQTHQHLHHPFITGGRPVYRCILSAAVRIPSVFQNIKGQAPAPEGAFENIDISCQESFQNTVCGQTGRISGCDIGSTPRGSLKSVFPPPGSPVFPEAPAFVSSSENLP